jgi:DNA replication protein DnaC
VLLVGPPGVGKSHLVQAIGREVLKAGFLVLYRSIFDLVRELLTQETQIAESRLLNKYLKPDLLIIDDMGLKILPQKSGEILLEIIMRRYENRSTMMTSNRPIEEWGKLLSDVPAASAILDRLLHHAEIIPINGRSYRLQPKAKRGAPSERKSRSPHFAFNRFSLVPRSHRLTQNYTPQLNATCQLPSIPLITTKVAGFDSITTGWF